MALGILDHSLSRLVTIFEGSKTLSICPNPLPKELWPMLHRFCQFVHHTWIACDLHVECQAMQITHQISLQSLLTCLVEFVVVVLQQDSHAGLEEVVQLVHGRDGEGGAEEFLEVLVRSRTTDNC